MEAVTRERGSCCTWVTLYVAPKLGVSAQNWLADLTRLPAARIAISRRPAVHSWVITAREHYMAVTGLRGLLFAVLLDSTCVSAWVLLSPFPRGNAGLGYSRAANLDVTALDWVAYDSNRPSLNRLVWHWPAPDRPDDGNGLGKGITYALHPDFCDLLLPNFPEDGANSGSLDAGWSSVSCDSLKTTIHIAFATWAANNPHLSFFDRTEECGQPGAIDPATNRCNRAEVLVSAADLTEEGGMVAYFRPDISVIDRSPLLTSGTELSDGLGLIRGQIVVTTGVCWYLDATFCTGLIQNFAAIPEFDLIMRFVLVLVVLFTTCLILYVLLRCCLASLGYHDAAQNSPIRQAGTLARSSTQRIARTVSGRIKLPPPSAPPSPPPHPPLSPPGSTTLYDFRGVAHPPPSHPPLSPPPSHPPLSPPPSPPKVEFIEPPTERVPVVAEDDDSRLSGGALSNNLMELHVIAVPELQISLKPALRERLKGIHNAGTDRGNAGMNVSIPFEIEGPPRVLGVLRRLGISTTGLLSPPRPVTISVDERRAVRALHPKRRPYPPHMLTWHVSRRVWQVGVPPNGDLFAFAYPFARPENLPYDRLLQVGVTARPPLPCGLH